MEDEIQIFKSFEESERADMAYYHSLMDILFELIKQGQGDEAAKGFERVYRIVKLHED